MVKGKKHDMLSLVGLELSFPGSFRLLACFKKLELFMKKKCVKDESVQPGVVACSAQVKIILLATVKSTEHFSSCFSL